MGATILNPFGRPTVAHARRLVDGFDTQNEQRTDMTHDDNDNDDHHKTTRQWRCAAYAPSRDAAKRRKQQIHPNVNEWR